MTFTRRVAGQGSLGTQVQPTPPRGPGDCPASTPWTRGSRVWVPLPGGATAGAEQRCAYRSAGRVRMIHEQNSVGPPARRQASAYRPATTPGLAALAVDRLARRDPPVSRPELRPHHADKPA